MTGGCRSLRYVLSTPVTRAAAVLLVLAAIASAAPTLAAPLQAATTGECFVQSLPAAHGDALDVQWLDAQILAPPLSAPPAPLPCPSTIAAPSDSNATAPRTPPPR